MVNYNMVFYNTLLIQIQTMSMFLLMWNQTLLSLPLMWSQLMFRLPLVWNLDFKANIVNPDVSKLVDNEVDMMKYFFKMWNVNLEMTFWLIGLVSKHQRLDIL